jgi:hypothetical protein
LIKASKKGELSMRKLYWLLTIISRHDTQEYETFFLSHGVENLISIPSSGTAHEHTLDMLGIERTEKTILLAAMNADMLKRIIRGLTVEMKIDLPDRGVAVAIPFSGIGGQRTLEYLSGDAALGESDKEDYYVKRIPLSHSYSRHHALINPQTAAIRQRTPTELWALYHLHLSTLLIYS